MPAPLCVFLKCLLQHEEGGELRWPPLCFFGKIYCRRRKRGGPYVFFEKKMGHRNGPLVFFCQNLLQEEEEGGS